MRRSPAPACLAGCVLFGLASLTPVAGRSPDAARPASPVPQQSQAQGRGGRGEPQKPPPPPDPRKLLEGSDEDDTVKGGTGDDWLFGKKGNDFLVAGAGKDVIDGSEGDDTIDAGADEDIVDGGVGADTIRAGDGDDTVEGGDEDDTIDGGAGADHLDGGDGHDMLRGGAGDDVLAGGDFYDTLFGQAGNDRLLGEDEPDSLFGGQGDDLLYGGEGDDVVDGEAGNDRVDGGDGNDMLRGGVGDDVILGSAGDDALHGGAGHDILLGGDGSDSISGGAGSDWVLAGTGADTVTTGEGDDLVVVRTGDVPAGELEVLNGGNGTDSLILNGFARLPAPVAGGPGANAAELFDPITGGTYRLINIERTDFTQLLTSVGTGPDRPVSLLLVNPSATAATGRVIVYGPDGAVVPVSIAGAEARELAPFTVPALGSLRLDGIARGQATLQVFAESPLGAVLHGDGRAAREAPLVDRAILPVIEDSKSGVRTGLVLTNSLTATNVNLEIFSQDGTDIDGETMIGAREIALAPYSQTTVFVRDLFPALGDFRGTLTIDGDESRAQEGGPVTITAFESSSSGRIASSPAITLGRSVPGRSLYLQNVTAGGDAASSILLLNASLNRPTQGTLRFFDETGKPWPVAVNGRPASATVQYDMTGSSGLVLTLPTGGPVQRGSVQAESTLGFLGVMMRTMLGTDVTRVVPSGPYSSVIAAVRRDRSSGTTTRVAVASTGAEVTLRFTLRAASGVEVAGGTAELPLAANGQIVRTLEQLFPAIPLDAFDGTLTIGATGGTIGVSVMQLDGGSTLGIALPVAVVE